MKLPGIYKILSFVWILASASACTQDDEFGRRKGGEEENTIKVNLDLFAIDGPVVTTRAKDLDNIMTYIDNVLLLVFKSTGEGDTLDPDDPVVYRNYYKYGEDQNIYLKTNENYWLFVIANLDADDVNIDGASKYFEDVLVYKDLQEKVLVTSSRSVDLVQKLVMTTENPIPVTLPNKVSGNLVNMKIGLKRLITKLVFNVYNKVKSQEDHTVDSGVFPLSWNALNVPISTFLMERPVITNTEDPALGQHDYPQTLDEEKTKEQYVQTLPQVLPAIESDAVFYKENWYTKQTFHMYTFENRRGSNSAITNAKQRKEKAPPHSTYIQLNAYTKDGVLVHYLHMGKGREKEKNAVNEPPLEDDITNFDVDRSCVYYTNIYINSATNIEEDTRREFLNQHVILTLPDVSRIDAHYMDVPAFVSGMNGFARLQSGTCTMKADGTIDYDTDGKPKNLVMMEDTDEDDKRWLRFSFYNPYRPTAKTSLYVTLNQSVDAYTGATTILHFNENVTSEYVDTSGEGGDPKKRTAVIRVGYIAGVNNATEYDQKAKEGLENAFYVPISQHGLKTIGQVGGYKVTDNVGSYTSLLGVESVEEYTFAYYYRAPNNDVPNNGPIWRYKDGEVKHNQAYDGKTATTDHYNDYRSQFSRGVPPKRTVNVYDPVFNTNAADYCMRKNRDENNDGIISGDEIKWYLPTPVQLMQMSLWRDVLKNSFEARTPFTQPYWSTNEVDNVYAYALDFSQQVDEVMPFDKTKNLSIRCVRDIATTSGGGGTSGELIYKTADEQHIGVNLNALYPPGMLEEKIIAGRSDNDIRSPEGNKKMQTYFLISRWYVTDKDNIRTNAPLFQGANNNPNCSNYREDGHAAGTWRLPTQRELAFIYANSGYIEELMKKSFGIGDKNYHSFTPKNHWGSTNIGNNSTFWGIDFSNGFSQVYKTGNGNIRCVKYLEAKAP